MGKGRITALLGGAVFLMMETIARAQGDSLTLAKAIDLGRKRAPELAVAKANVDSASADVSSARAPYFPTLSASISGQGVALRDTPILLPDNVIVKNIVYTAQGTVGASLRWTLVDFGRTSNGVAAAEGAQSSANAQADNADVNLISDVASAYVSAAYRDELRAMANVTVSQRDKLRELAKALVKSGLQPPVEELRAASRLEAAKRTLVAAETDALDARATLASLLGETPTMKIARPKLPSVDLDVARATKAAEDRRETIRAARALVDSKHSAKDAARSRYYPTLSLQADASYRLAQQDTNKLFTSTRTASAAIVLSGPLFDMGVYANVDAADADAAVAEAQLNLATRDAKTEATRAAIAVKGAASAVDHAKKAEESAAIVFQVVQARYEKGLASPSELIDAESSDADARTARTNAEMAHALNVVRLLVATGQSKRLYEEGSQ